MKKILIVVITLGLLLMMAIPAAANASTVYHVYNGESIQQAIDNAEPGDAIVIHAGTYRELIHINVSDITLSGEGAIIDGTDFPDQEDGLLNISSYIHGVTIESLEIRNFVFGDHGGNGIFVQNESHSNTLMNIIIHDANGAGIFLAEGSHHNTIKDNYIYGCENGLGASYSHDNQIIGNKTKNNGIGIFMGNGCTRNTVAVNSDSGSNQAGIILNGVKDGPPAQGNVIEGNSVKKSAGPAILLTFASGNIIKENKIDKSGTGIEIGEFSVSNIVEKNDVRKSEKSGIMVGPFTDNNAIRENEVKNSGKFDLYSHPDSGTNIWIDNKYSTANF
jgi:parallel beta-helix repeat protein